MDELSFEESTLLDNLKPFRQDSDTTCREEPSPTVTEFPASDYDGIQIRLLGFYRVPPTVGRRINITSELEPILPELVADTVFVSPAGNMCFFGECDYFCDSALAFCGSPDTIEVSMMSYLPSRNVAPRVSVDPQPYRRSYSYAKKAYWEMHEDLCDKLKADSRVNNGKLLTDVIDVHTFDFLTGNKDRHGFSFFKDFGNYSFPILYDNGRGFGRQTYDAMSILAPLRQCCMIRKSTLLKYIKIYQGPDKLSNLMEKALANDPVAPVLIRGHLTALDRRLLKILRTVAVCLEENKMSYVIVDDGF